MAKSSWLDKKLEQKSFRKSFEKECKKLSKLEDQTKLKAIACLKRSKKAGKEKYGKN